MHLHNHYIHDDLYFIPTETAGGNGNDTHQIHRRF